MGIRLLRWLILLFILGIAAYFRLVNLAENPGWYSDEATHVDIAHHMMNGEIRYLALKDSMLLVARPPLFHVILSVVFRATEVDILPARTLTAVLGVVAVALIYVAAAHGTQNQDFGLLASAMMALYPDAIFFSRIAFSYNLVAVFVLGLLIGLTDYLRTGQRKWLALAAVMVGLSSITDLVGVTFGLAVLIVVIYRRWRDLLWAVPLMVAPFVGYAIVMVNQAPEAFIFDWQYTFGRVTGGLGIQFIRLMINQFLLVYSDVWVFAGLIGLCLVRPLSFRFLSLLVFITPLTLLGRSVGFYEIGRYYTIPVIPFTALGIAVLISVAYPFVRQMWHEGFDRLFAALPYQRRHSLTRFATMMATLLMVVAPICTLCVLLYHYVNVAQPSSYDPIMISSRDARATAAFLDEHTEQSDLIVASPTVGWQFNSDTADFQMALAAAGQATEHLPGDIPADRWVFDPRFDVARYVVIDNAWRNWALENIMNLEEKVEDIEKTWRQVFKAGEIQVYERPRG